MGQSANRSLFETRPFSSQLQANIIVSNTNVGSRLSSIDPKKTHTAPPKQHKGFSNRSVDDSALSSIMNDLQVAEITGKNSIDGGVGADRTTMASAMPNTTYDESK